MKVLLDTNFLVYCAKQKIDYFEKISKIINPKPEIVILSSVSNELKSLTEKSKKTKDKESAKLALKILEKRIKEKKIKTMKTEKKSDKNADDAILNLAKNQNNVIVATADRELKKKLKGKSRILTIKQKKNIELI